MKRALSSFALLSLLALAMLPPSALAADKEAESCLRTKVWASYEDGWSVRNQTRASLAVGGTHSFRVTLYKGTEYQIVTCGEASIRNLDVLLYNAEGEVVARDGTTGRDPTLSFTPSETATYYVVLYLRDRAAQDSEGSVSMAVTYR